ncbi:MAG: hypothetical protein AB1715_04930 [Acidobacteriota bacterium]
MRSKPALIGRILHFFIDRPCPPAVFQLSSSFVSGIQVAVKERKIKNAAILSLPPGLVQPHFDRKNVTDPASLAAVMKEALRKLHVSGKWAACLLPESCLKVFVLQFDSLPASPAERENLVRWKVKKQMPVIPDDTRLSYEVISSARPVKVVLALARKAVIEEYEALFAGVGLKVGAASVPTLSLLNLVDSEKDGDLLVANIEDDSLSLAAVTQSELALYRHKALGGDRTAGIPGDQSVENIVKEIENTIHFIEDREKREIRSLWLRTGMRERAANVVAELGERFSGAIRMVDPLPLASLSPEERSILAPLFGQII